VPGKINTFLVWEVLETNVSNKLPYLTQIPMSSLCCKGEDKINYDDTTHFEGRWEMHKKF
jgi:hypothetical protein